MVNRAAFRRQGYVVIHDVLPVATIETLRRHALDLMRGDSPAGEGPQARGWEHSREYMLVDAAVPDVVPLLTRKYDNVRDTCEDLRSLVMSPVLGELARALLEVEAVRLWQDKLFIKPPGDSCFGEVDLHQDYYGWRYVDRPEMVSLWLPLVDTDDQNGAIQYVSGSHHLGLRPELNYFANFRRADQVAALAAATPEPLRTLAVRAGDGVFHHCLTLHASGRNLGKSHRPALVICYMSATCRWSAAGESGPRHFMHLAASAGIRAGGDIDGDRWPVLALGRAT